MAKKPPGAPTRPYVKINKAQMADDIKRLQKKYRKMGTAPQSVRSCPLPPAWQLTLARAAPSPSQKSSSATCWASAT